MAVQHHFQQHYNTEVNFIGDKPEYLVRIPLNYGKLLTKYISNSFVPSMPHQCRQENFWAPGQKETWPPSSNSPNNDIQTKFTTMCHKKGISTTIMN